MIVQVLKYGFVCDGPGGCRKTAPAPESAAPVPLANFGKFALDPVGRTALHLTDGIGDGEFLGHGHDHVHVVTGQNAMQDVDTVLLAYLATNGPNPEPQVADQDLVAVLRRPDDSVSLKRGPTGSRRLQTNAGKMKDSAKQAPIERARSH